MFLIDLPIGQQSFTLASTSKHRCSSFSSFSQVALEPQKPWWCPQLPQLICSNLCSGASNTQLNNRSLTIVNHISGAPNKSPNLTMHAWCASRREYVNPHFSNDDLLLQPGDPSSSTRWLILPNRGLLTPESFQAEDFVIIMFSHSRIFSLHGSHQRQHTTTKRYLFLYLSTPTNQCSTIHIDVNGNQFICQTTHWFLLVRIVAWILSITLAPFELWLNRSYFCEYKRIMGTSWKHVVFVNMRTVFPKNESFWKSYVPFVVLKFCVPPICIIFCEDEDRKMMKIG